MKYIVLILIFSLSIRTIFSAQTNEELLYQQILKKTFSDEKKIVSIKLGELKTAAAKDYLLKLLSDASGWNNEAAVYGLYVFNSYETDQILVDQYFKDIFTEKEIEVIITKEPKRYIKLLLAIYDRLEQKSRIEKLIILLGKMPDQEAEDFLKKIIEDQSSSYRAKAFKEISLNFKTGNFDYIKNLMNDPELKELALMHIVKNGNREHLPIFLSVIEKKEADKYQIIAFQAVNQWGDESLKKSIYLDVLKNGNNSLIEGALLIFELIQSEEIRKTLISLLKTSPVQNIRLKSAENLLAYQKKEIIPAVLPVLKEQFISDQNLSGFDIFTSIITLGLTPLMDKYNRSRDKKSFDARLSQIRQNLTRIAGVNPGPNYNDWLEWAVLNGYSVNQTNIIQYLFSGSLEKRKIAIRSAIYLAGYQSEKEFYTKNPELLKADETELLVALARILIAKGYMKEEEP